jgi:hypothetical protein
MFGVSRVVPAMTTSAVPLLGGGAWMNPSAFQFAPLVQSLSPPPPSQVLPARATTQAIATQTSVENGRLSRRDADRKMHTSPGFSAILSASRWQSVILDATGAKYNEIRGPKLTNSPSISQSAYRSE